MNAYASDRRRSKLPLLVALLVILLGALGAGAWWLAPRFEREAPQITLAPAADVVGSAPLSITLTDKGTGLAGYTVTLQQGGNEVNLGGEQFATPVPSKTLSIALARTPGVKEGPATLRVTARDASLFKANVATLDKPITIDITPPTLELIADDRYVNFGGVGALVYKASPDTVTSGVKLGSHFFPGYAGQVAGHPDRMFVLFAHAYDTAPDARATLVATDAAGNTRELRVGYELKDVKYRKSTIALSDAFLQNKVAPLLSDAAARQGTPKEVFVAVNKALRKENEAKIAEITAPATPKRLWDGAFAQLSNSKVEANFADLRTYTYNGEPVDTAYHLGYDLSVTKAYPVEAANSGTVAFTGDLGIYGNTVVIDHGLGLYTLYSHLSAIDVKQGETVAKKQIVGKTGETGLAAGDHLHYGVYLDGVAVLPVEWWDAKWIGDNITPKLEGRTGTEIAEAQQPVRAKKAKAATGKKAAAKKSR
jgi:murein DD-endopeptidase MepM/ murein hydrolase activator NlpD